MTAATRTFDCPWCGAISPVPADHLGEHFVCPECAKATKLTPKNTSDRPPTAPPPGAPPTGGLRTFDCPWCGAISPIPASHLGERFACAECHRETKLTAANTQAAAVTAPPPGAPHVEARRPFVVWGVVGACALAAAVGAFLLLQQEGEAPSDERPSVAAPSPSAGRPPSPGRATPAPTPPPSDDDRPPPPSSIPASPAPSPSAPAPAPRVDLAVLEADVAAATAALGEANQRLLTAMAALSADEAAAARRRDAATESEAFAAILSAVRERTAEATSPAAVRAAREAVVAHLAADPDRVRRAERVRTWLASDLFGREVAGVTDWRGLDWTGPGAARALAALSAEAGAAAAPPSQDLAAEAASARGAVEEATHRLETARARLAAAQASEAGTGPR